MTTTPTTESIDEARLEQLMGRLIGNMTGTMMCFGIGLGDDLGLYRALSGGRPTSAGDLAQQTGCHPRLVREWLDGQAAGGLVTYEPESDSYRLSPEAERALANDAAPEFVARAMGALRSMVIDQDKIAEAFRGDGALPWGDHHPTLFTGTEWFFRTGYEAELPEWITALDGVHEKLAAGGRVADVGCGHGASAIVLAAHYPHAQVTGFDFHESSISTAKRRAAEAGVSGSTSFAVADAKGYDGTYDVICFFDCLHDMGDPVGVARHALDRLAPDGTVLLVEPFALDSRAANIADNPLAALLYHASLAVCTPNSLAQEVGLGLGAQAGEARHRQVFTAAGFSRFRKAAETPMNLVLEARP